MKIAIDGPAGAGKSTIAKRVAEELGFLYVDTGALYRAVGLFVLRNGKNPKDSKTVTALLDKAQVDLRHLDGTQHVFLNGEDVSDAIRTPEASMAASDVSAICSVRQFLFETQRSIAATRDVVMDGRDIGTVVLPDADVKIFLTASALVRADRRYRELLEKGQKVLYPKVLEEVLERDQQDSQREIAPLRQAPDATKLDSTGMNADEVTERVIKLVRDKKSKI